MNNQDLLKMIKDEDIAYVDIRFTEEGFMFDGSSIAGWKSIEASDMKLMPDASSAYIDPFYAEKTLCVHCSIAEPDTGEHYHRDTTATRAARRRRPKPI